MNVFTQQNTNAVVVPASITVLTLLLLRMRRYDYVVW